MSAEFQTVAAASDIQDGQGFPVDLDGVPIAIFRVAGEYYAIADSCPHQGAPLCDGAIIAGSVACSWHGWRFDLSTGQRVDAKKGQIATYPVRLHEGMIQLAPKG